MKVQLNKFYENVAPEYVEAKREEVSELKGYLAEKNFDKLELLAHRLAGSAGSYQLFDLGKLGSELENLSLNRDVENCQKVIDQIEAYLVDLVIEFE